MLTVFKMHRPKADINRVYVKRKEGVRGLLQIEATYKAEIINIAEYLNTDFKDQCVYIVKSHESIQPNLNFAFTYVIPTNALMQNKCNLYCF
jgi:hypothetical protein